MQKFINMIFPARCPSCKIIVHNNGDMCATCWSKIRFISNCCDKCGYPTNFSNIQTCSMCVDEEYHFDFAKSVCVYDDNIKSLILALKYSDKTEISLVISKFIANLIKQSQGWQNATLTVTPISRKSMIERGFNQSALIAMRIARILNIKYDPQIFAKIKHTAKQSAIYSAKERKTNLRGAIVLNKVDKTLENIIIIDDVFTTGATFNECAKCIKSVNPSAVVSCYSFAKTIID